MPSVAPVDALPGVLKLVDAASAAILEVYAAGATRSSSRPTTHRLPRPTALRIESWPTACRNWPPASRCSPKSPRLRTHYAVRGGWRTLWLVDPLDGTKEFISRNGEFTVNVALIQDGRPVLGVVAAPAMGTTYYAADGVGAFRIAEGAAAAPIHVRRAGDTVVVVGSRSHRGDSLDAVLAEARQARAAPDGQRTQDLPGRRRHGGFLPAARTDFRMGHRGGAGRARGRGRCGHDDTRRAAALQPARHDPEPALPRVRRSLRGAGRALFRPIATHGVVAATRRCSWAWRRPQRSGTRTLGARELANVAALDTCTPRRCCNCSTAPSRSAVCAWSATKQADAELERTYLFDYTLDGATRRQGFVIISGRSSRPSGCRTEPCRRRPRQGTICGRPATARRPRPAQGFP